MSNQPDIDFDSHEITHWADVVLPLALPQVYTYAVPTHLLGKIEAGFRVEVVFGKNKKYAGIVKLLRETKPAYPTKTILNVLDDAPLLYAQQLRFGNG